MNLNLKKIFFFSLFNLLLFLMMIIGVQNSKSKTKINFIINETINLPIGFIIGTSFVCGSISGSFLNFNISYEKK
tara:strand:- start:297 stop:521 length:225 start_codon:yes stop_codon:yes gene_type:complete